MTTCLDQSFEIVEMEQNTPEWHAWRQNGIGSSDIAKLMGISPFGTAMNVYNEKAGVAAPTQQTESMRRGKAIEPRALELFNGNRFNFKPTCVQNTQKSYMRASLDGYDGSAILEIKRPGKKVLDLARDGIIPDYYAAQIQWGLEITKLPLGWYACYDEERDENIEIPATVNPEMGRIMAQAAEKFWNDFLMGIQPIPQKSDKQFITCPEFGQIAASGRGLKDALEVAEAQFDEWKKQILQYGQDRTFSGYGLTVVRTDARKTYDINAMKMHGIDVDKFQKISVPGWRITFDK